MIELESQKHSPPTPAADMAKAVKEELQDGVRATKAAGARSKETLHGAANVIADDVREATTRATEALRGAANVVESDVHDAAQSVRERGTYLRRALRRGARDLRRSLKRSWARLRGGRHVSSGGAK